MIAVAAGVKVLVANAPLPWGPHDSPADKARAVMEHLSIVEAEELGLALRIPTKSPGYNGIMAPGIPE